MENTIGTYLRKLGRISEGLNLALDLVRAGLDGHTSHMEAEGEQALLALVQIGIS